MTWIILGVIVLMLVFFLSRRKPLPPADLSFLPPRFIIFDLETTGLNPERNKIIEIGAIRANRDSNHHDAFQALIKIKGKVPEKITEITGITDAMLQADGKPLDKALDEFLDFIGDLRVISFNAPFDTGFINAALKTCTKPRLKNPVSCALNMARRAFPGRKSYKLSELAKDGGLDTQNHRALDDCKLALMVYTAAANKLRQVA